jgi:hypothetical protein
MGAWAGGLPVGRKSSFQRRRAPWFRAVTPASPQRANGHGDQKQATTVHNNQARRAWLIEAEARYVDSVLGC